MHKDDGAVHEHMALLVRREDTVAVIDRDDNVDQIGGVAAAADLYGLHDERAACCHGWRA